MKRYFITYSDAKYALTKSYCLKSAERFHFFDELRGYEKNDVDADFFTRNRQILSNPRGGGLWLWKPYFIHRTLQEIDDGDLLVYCDAGSFFVRTPMYLEESMLDGDIWLSDIPLIEKQFTHPSLFKTLGCEEFMDTPQVQANFIAVRKSRASSNFIVEWLNLCSNVDIMAPEKCTEEASYFISHRYDQSVLSLLSKKYGIRKHLDPSQYGKYPFRYYAEGRMFEIPKHPEEYPILIALHRSSKVTLKTLLTMKTLCFAGKYVVQPCSTGYWKYKEHCRQLQGEQETGATP